MDTIRLHYAFYLHYFLVCIFMFQNSVTANFIPEDEKVELRRALDEVTQSHLVEEHQNILYHSYIFKSGAGNREELRIDGVEKDISFTAGAGVLSWQSVQCGGKVFLLGRCVGSISLLVTSAQLQPNGSAQFFEHTLEMSSDVTSTEIYTRWNNILDKEEVIVVVALAGLPGDIMWYKVEVHKLVNISCWSRYKQTACMAVVKTAMRDQLVVSDDLAPATVEFHDIIYTDKVELRLAQSFLLASECTSITVCKVAPQLYIAFTQPSLQSVVVYQSVKVANFRFFENYATLSLPGVSQVVLFTLANQVHLAFNGDKGYVFQLTSTGLFVEKLSIGSVSKWLAVPVTSYRSDVVLFSQNANSTDTYIWRGTSKGFEPAPKPQCDDCLEGDWSGGVVVQLGSKSCLIMPLDGSPSKLVTITTSLHLRRNPISEQIESMSGVMQKYDERLQQVQLKLFEAEEFLKQIIKVDGENIITAKWKLGRVLTPHLYLSSMMIPKENISVLLKTATDEPIDVSTLNYLFEEMLRSAEQLKQQVLQKEKETWGLETFSGKMNMLGSLIVENLTVINLNDNNMDDVLQYTFRKDKPQVIQGDTVIHSLQVENINVSKINNLTMENMKFSDDRVLANETVTFLKPLHIEGDVSLRGGFNGLNLSKKLCQGEDHCAVLPSGGYESKSRDNKGRNKINLSYITKHKWTRVIGGKNLTVNKINGEPWENIMDRIVFIDKYQQIPETTIIKGTLTSDEPIWIVEDYRSLPREDDHMSAAPSETKPVSITAKEHKFPINPNSDMVVTKLEVTGTVFAEESDWGEALSNVVLKDSHQIHIYGDKVFNSDVSVANNLEIKGLIGGVNVSDLLTTDTSEVFSDLITLVGNVTVGNVTLSGSWNGKHISKSGTISNDTNLLQDVNTNYIRVSDTLNGIPVAQFSFDSGNATSLDQLTADQLNVTDYMTVQGKICDQDLKNFKEKRLSKTEEQTLSGQFIINNAKVLNEFVVENLNNMDMAKFSFQEVNSDVIHLSALSVDGNITTEFGLNNYNLTDLAAHAVWILSNTVITGHLNFMEEVTIDVLECQGFLNEKLCQDVFEFQNVVFKSNRSTIFSGEITFMNAVRIDEEMMIEKLNGHSTDSILTKITTQEIRGAVTIVGNLTVAEGFTVDGLLNTHNLTDTLTRCVLSDGNITCTGDVEFEDSVYVDHLNCMGAIEGVDFNKFVVSLVNIHIPQQITAFKNLTGNVTVKNMDVHKLNIYSWDDFLVNTVRQNSIEAVESVVTFLKKVKAPKLSVDYDLEADSINDFNMNEWRTNAIYLNSSVCLKRFLHLSSASSAGNITVVTYGHVNMDVDLIKLHSPNVMDHLAFESVQVFNPSNVGLTVNGKKLDEEEKKTIKISGDQRVLSDLVVSGAVSVTGNVIMCSQVNHHNLLDVVTLDTDQHLHGNYKFECIKANKDVSAGELVSGVNMTEWKESAVVDRGRQDLTGTWTVSGDVVLKGPARGRLAHVDLAQLNANITRHILDVHRDLKKNLTSFCKKTNSFIKQARNQTSEFLYMKLVQEIEPTQNVSLVTSFKKNNGAFLTVSDSACTTTFYKWDKTNGSFAMLFSKSMGTQILTLHQQQQTYLLSVSPHLSVNCHSGKHLWLFDQQTVKHVSAVDIGTADSVEVYNNYLYTMNSTGIHKWTVQSTVEGKIHLNKIHMWSVKTGGMKLIPERWGLGSGLHNLTHISTLEKHFQLGSDLSNKWTSKLVSVSINPTRQFISVFSPEKAQVPRQSDHVKVYRMDGMLFDKLPAQQASHLHWLSVPMQTWLAYIDNYTTLNLYQLQDGLKGFQLRQSVNIEGITSLSSLELPLASKVNRQPYLVVQTTTSVQVLQLSLRGDPFPGPDLPCSFNDAFIPGPL